MFSVVIRSLVYGTITAYESVRIYIVARTRHCWYAHDIDERSSDLLEWFSRRSVRSEPVPIVFNLFSRTNRSFYFVTWNDLVSCWTLTQFIPVDVTAFSED